MANKREFKKYVDALGASIISEIAIAYENVEGADKDGLQNAYTTVLGAVFNAKSNANLFFDRGRKGFAEAAEYKKAKDQFFRSLFNKIEKDFSDQVNEGLKLFNAALPASEKEANKEAVKQ